MKSLFFGVIPEDVIFPYPRLGEAERERVQTLVGLIGHFADAEIDPVAIDQNGRIPDDVLKQAREMGLMGLTVPHAHGGLGLSHAGYARVLQEVAARDASLASLLYVHEALGAQAIVNFGSTEQQERFLPDIASGERMVAFALTESGSGSDPGAVTTTLVEDGDGYVLTGTKNWVTGGDIAGLFVVFARTSRNREGNRPKIAAVLVPKGEGVTIGPRLEKLGLKGVGVCNVSFDGVRVSRDDILGEKGKGHRIAMEVLNLGRVALAATLVGQCRAVVNLAVSSVQKRRSFGRMLSEFPLIKDKISRMMADAYAIESMTHLTAGLVDSRVADFSLESTICRVAGSEALWRVVNDAMQLAGGSGYIQPHAFERHLRDARGAFVIDGTNETLRCFIALSGLQGPGRKLSEVATAMREPVKGFGLLREFAVKKVRETFRRERLSRAHPLLARESVLLEASTEAFAQASERALRDHGKEIAEMQYTQVRLANIAIDLYALAATISRTSRAVQQRGEEGARRELDLTTMFASAAERRIRGHLAGLEHNDDELRKLIASRTYTDNGYPFDII